MQVFAAVRKVHDLTESSNFSLICRDSKIEINHTLNTRTIQEVGIREPDVLIIQRERQISPSVAPNTHSLADSELTETRNLFSKLCNSDGRISFSRLAFEENSLPVKYVRALVASFDENCSIPDDATFSFEDYEKMRTLYLKLRRLHTKYAQQDGIIPTDSIYAAYQDIGPISPKIVDQVSRLMGSNHVQSLRGFFFTGLFVDRISRRMERCVDGKVNLDLVELFRECLLFQQNFQFTQITHNGNHFL